MKLNENILKHTGHDPTYLLENGCLDELVSRVTETVNQIFGMYLASELEELDRLLGYESSILGYQAACLKNQDQHGYMLFCLGSLFGTVEAFTRLRYEHSQDEWTAFQYQADLRTVRHLADMILALEVHGPMTHRELGQSLRMKPSTLTEAMKRVLATGVIDVRPSGKHKIYSLTDTGLRLGRELRRRKHTAREDSAPPQEGAPLQIMFPSGYTEASACSEDPGPERQPLITDRRSEPLASIPILDEYAIYSYLKHLFNGDTDSQPPQKDFLTEVDGIRPAPEARNRPDVLGTPDDEAPAMYIIPKNRNGLSANDVRKEGVQ